MEKNNVTYLKGRVTQEQELRKQKAINGELLYAYRKLSDQHQLKQEQAAELLIINEELTRKNKRHKKDNEDLILANNRLVRSDQAQREQIRLLSEMMFITSHKIRQPIAHILGLSNLIDTLMDSPEELRRAVNYICQSAQMLDNVTRELTFFLHEQEQKLRKRKREL